MPISFACPSCGNQLQVSDAAAGRAGKCPHCKGAIQVPLASVPAGAITAAPAPLASASATAHDTPVAQGKSPWPMLGALVGGGSLVVLGVLLIALFFTGGGGSGAFTGFSLDPMIFLPDNTQAIAVMRFGEMKNSPAFKEIDAAARAMGKSNNASDSSWDQQFEQIGIAPDNIALVTAAADVSSAFSNPASPSAVYIIQTKNAITPEEMKAKIKDKIFTEGKAGSYTYHEGPEEKPLFGQPKPGLAFAVVDKKVVVMTTRDLIKGVLERGKRPELSEAMQTALRELSTPRSMSMAMSLKELVARPEVKQGAGALPTQAQQFVGDLESLMIQVVMDKDIDISAAVLLNNEKSADDLRKMIEGFLALAKLGAGKDLPPEAIEIMDSIKFETKGNRLNGAMQVKTASVVKLIQSSAKKGPAFLP